MTRPMTMTHVNVRILARGFRIRFSFRVNEFAIAPVDCSRTMRDRAMYC